MSLADRIKRVYAKRILKSKNGFAENGKFGRRRVSGQPADSSGKPIRTSVFFRSQADENEGTREKVTTIGVWMLKDEDHELGGVSELRTGDLYWRDPEFDSDNRPFSFTGVTIEEGQHYRVAEFQRYDVESFGRGV